MSPPIFLLTMPTTPPPTRRSLCALPPEGVHLEETTLQTSFEVHGAGIHGGVPATVRLSPAPPGSGVRFVCLPHTALPDLREPVEIPALANRVVDTRRCTSLGAENARLDTVEHLLSALYGLGIDNARIEVCGPEIPILDGSALPWVERILAAGLVTQGRARVPLSLSRTVALSVGDSWLVAAPADRFSITCVAHWEHPLLGTLSATFAADPRLYAQEIAPARTFGFAAEIEALRKAGLAKGGTLENALVIYDDHFSDSLRVPDECLRHKMLDLWGDLSLVGGVLNARITAIKPGHRINTAFAALLAENSV